MQVRVVSQQEATLLDKNSGERIGLIRQHGATEGWEKVTGQRDPLQGWLVFDGAPVASDVLLTSGTRTPTVFVTEFVLAPQALTQSTSVPSLVTGIRISADTAEIGIGRGSVRWLARIQPEGSALTRLP